ncbi:MAG: hypothetical protein V3U10_04975, partial [Bacteroidota bacterium]
SYGSSGWVSLVLASAIVGVMLCGCAGSVGSRSGWKYKYWYELRRPSASDRLEFEDDRIFIQFRIDESFINFRLQNLSGRTLSVLWDRITLAVDGKIAPIKYSANEYDLQPARWTPAAIPPDARLIDFVVPAENLQFIGGTWRERDLFPTRDFGRRNLRREIVGNVDKRITWYLPLSYGDQVLEYVFEFEVTEVEELDWKYYRAPKRGFGSNRLGPAVKGGWLTVVVLSVFIVAGVYFLIIREPTPVE